MTDVRCLLEDFYLTMPEGIPSHTEVMQYVPEPPRTHRKLPAEPVWAIRCLLIGAFLLVASGTFLLALGVVL